MQAEQSGSGRQTRAQRPVLMLGYSALLGLGLALSAPWWLARMATTRRYREGLRGRMGAVPGALRAAVAGKRVVWVHAVSVGEVLAVSRLLGELEAALNGSAIAGEKIEPPWTVVVSTTTATGQALARERFGAERVFYFPLDFAWPVRRYLKVLRPALLVLAESELWPRVLHECARLAIPVAVVNARVSDRSFRRGLRVRPVWARVLQGVTLWLAQSEEDARRIRASGARADSVQVRGNLKYDVRAPEGSRMAELIRAAAGGRPILVAGSTADRVAGQGLDENEMLIEAWAGEARRKGVLLVLAPRQPDSFRAVYSVALEFRARLATEMAASARRDLPDTETDGPREVEVIVLDTLGDLAAVYGTATIAFVGGSLLPKGGHNPLEPAQFGVPVVIGPSFENFREIVREMKAAGAILVAEDRSGLRAVFSKLLNDPDEARATGERGRAVFEREGGATTRSVQALVRLIQPDSIPESPEAVSA